MRWIINQRVLYITLLMGLVSYISLHLWAEGVGVSLLSNCR